MDIDSKLSEIKKAYQEGNLNESYKGLMVLYRQNKLDPSMFLILAQTVQRLRRYEEAHKYLDEGINISKGEQRVALLNLKAQIYSSQNEWERAIEAYERLIDEEKRPVAKRFSRRQLARIYYRLGDLEKAKNILDTILEDFPDDEITLRMLAGLDQSGYVKVSTAQIDGDDKVKELQVDLSDEGIELISRMLRRDLATAEFRDEKILMQGGRPEVEDADRLLKQAEEIRASEFGERYPAFLEAAKAYSELPEGSYTLGDFYRALTRYAMLKGSALVSEIRRRAYSSEINLEELMHLRDSATSYYIESLVLQVRVDRKYALIPLTNLLRAQIAYSMLATGESALEDLFKLNMSELFRLCHSGNDEILRIAYESVISVGAASGYVWNQLQELKGGPGMLWNLLDLPSKRTRPYKIISSMIGEYISVTQKPGEVLKLAFIKRRENAKNIQAFFNSLQQIPLQIQNIQEIKTKWDEFPHRNTLLDTEQELLDGVNAILGTLLPYQTRSTEERTGILFTARTNIETLLYSIQASPTYWGRVGFDPLLHRWQSAIREIEQQRLGEIQPRLFARLEPPVFYLKGDLVEGGIILQNIGRGTAEGAVLQLEVCSLDQNKLLFNNEIYLREEISAGGTRYQSIKIPMRQLVLGLELPYRIRANIAPIFRGIVLEFEEQEFTLELPSGTKFTINDIPWNEIEIPSEHLFKGREHFIERLESHLLSFERNKTYILYGLTRTGKSSILRYLSKRLDLKQFMMNENEYKFITLEWNIGTANAHSNARDMWGYLLEKCIIEKLNKLGIWGTISPEGSLPPTSGGNMRFRDWEPILDYLLDIHIYPIFLLDEFSYFRSLVDSKRIDASFLAAIRQFAIDGKASFIFAGTYDLRKLIKDPAYGITGQLVNAIETRVSRIDREPAIELIQVMSPKFRFTQDAVEFILRLSYQIPYFIQLLCKNCAIYAVNSGRGIFGYPEVETVVRTMTGESNELVDETNIPSMAPGVFMNNMQTPTDPVEYNALISTICHLTKDIANPRMITYPEIQSVWDRHNVKFFQARLANAIQELKDREVLIEGEDEGVPAYQITVDLFRRWWTQEHRNLSLELDSVKQEL